MVPWPSGKLKMATSSRPYLTIISNVANYPFSTPPKKDSGLLWSHNAVGTRLSLVIVLMSLRTAFQLGPPDYLLTHQIPPNQKKGGSRPVSSGMESKLRIFLKIGYKLRILIG